MKTNQFTVKSIIVCMVVFMSIWMLSGLVYRYTSMPDVIEQRAKDLNLMQYDSKKDKFIGKDSVCISRWDLYYLQYGNLKGY